MVKKASYLTGLLGVNVGGIPLASNSMGFSIISVGLFIILLFFFVDISQKKKV